ncbi:MAG: hypothetical protein ABJB47_06555, partial [Actinomycetota bacterium]
MPGFGDSQRQFQRSQLSRRWSRAVAGPAHRTGQRVDVGARATADLESAESSASAESRGGNKETSELGQNGGCGARRGFEFINAPGDIEAVSKKNEYRFCR